MSFWVITNIDVWLLGGVIFSISWALYKALEHDAEKHEERIKRLENDIEDLYKKIRRRNYTEKEIEERREKMESLMQESNKKKNKVNVRLIMGVLIILLGLVLTIKLLVPMVLGIVGMYMALTILYKTLDITGKFYGGIFFLFVSWYIFLAIAYWIIKLMTWGYNFAIDKQKGTNGG